MLMFRTHLLTYIQNKGSVVSYQVMVKMKETLDGYTLIQFIYMSYLKFIYM